MFQIRIHGRGGQGVVTAAEIIAIAAFNNGYEAQAFPAFGVERTGAPIQAFARISKTPIIVREQVQRPDIVIIQDQTLLGLPELFAGSTAKTKFIINSQKNAAAILDGLGPIKDKPKASQITSIDATGIALQILKKNITNTVILGAFAKTTGLISLESLEKAIAQKFSDKGRTVIEGNRQAVAAAYKISK